jgi:hypothetical protein
MIGGRGRSMRQLPSDIQRPGMMAGRGRAMQQPTLGVQHPGMMAGRGGPSVDAALPGYMHAYTPPIGQPSKPPTTRPMGPNGDVKEQTSLFGPICPPAPSEPIYPPGPIGPIFPPEPIEPICPPRPIGPICPPAKTDHDLFMSQAPFLINSILNLESGNKLMGKGYSNQGPNCPGRLRCSKCGPACFGGPIRQNFGTHGVSVQALKSLQQKSYGQQLNVSKFLCISL